MRPVTESNAVRVAIIGAGLGGIATAVKLKQAGIKDVTIFERAAGPGGVWWQNTYPGCEVDVPSHAYSFSFMPYDWIRTHASQAEIQAYVEHTLNRFGIRDWLTFSTDVSAASWDDGTAQYTLNSGERQLGTFDVVVSCVGMLSDPKMPDWPGLADFAGPIFHTSRYPAGLDVSGKRVALVGTGSTAAQLGPAIAAEVSQLDLYQREPGWVLPKKVVEFTGGERHRFMKRPALRKIHRMNLFREARKTADAYQVGTDKQRELRSYCVAGIAKIVKDPATAAALTPDYAFGCKRPVFSSAYYPMFNRDNVTLIPSAVSRVTPDGIVDVSGRKRPADIVILSTGFEATRYLTSLEVSGRGGRSLHDTWGDEPTAFLGITVPDFPNFFIVYGPNTNGGWSVIAQLEPQANVVARAVRRLARGQARIVDTKPVALERYDSWVQGKIANKLSALAVGCNNYYHSATGKNVTQWPLGHATYRIATAVLPRWGLVFTTRRHDAAVQSHESGEAPLSRVTPAGGPARSGRRERVGADSPVVE